jgi:hypothetical protein
MHAFINEVIPIWGTLRRGFPSPLQYSKTFLTLKEAKFFNYSAKMGYKIGMLAMQKESRLIIKAKELDLMTCEVQQTIGLVWDRNKT